MSVKAHPALEPWTSCPLKHILPWSLELQSIKAHPALEPWTSCPLKHILLSYLTGPCATGVPDGAMWPQFSPEALRDAAMDFWWFGPEWLAGGRGWCGRGWQVGMPSGCNRAGLLGSLDTGQLSVWRSAGYNHRGQGSPFGRNKEVSF